MNFTEFVRPVRLPSVALEDPDVYAGYGVSIMGWGDRRRTKLLTADIQVYGKR